MLIVIRHAYIDLSLRLLLLRIFQLLSVFFFLPIHVALFHFGFRSDRPQKMTTTTEQSS